MFNSLLPASPFKEPMGGNFSKKCDLFSRSPAYEWPLQAYYHSVCFLFVAAENTIQQNLQLYCSLNYGTVASFTSVI